MNNDSFSHDAINSQFALSYELLLLLQWISKHEVDKLKKIITKAIAQGLDEHIQKIDTFSSNDNLLENMQHSMIDFFELLDSLLIEALNENVDKKARGKNLLSTIDQIDSTICDSETVRSSLEKTTNALENYPNNNPKEQLFKELLKKWKPVNKHCLN